jgi:hypothetical protein
MTDTSSASRAPRLVWGLVVALVLLIGGAVWFWKNEKAKAGGRPGGYVLAMDANSRVGGWFPRPLATTRRFAAGQTVNVPDGSCVRLIHPDGRSEDLVGKARVELPALELRGEAMDNFLGVPLAELANVTPVGTNSAAGDVRVVSPVGVTRFTNPTIVWAARPETDYDVAIIDPADPMAPPRIAEKIRPPVTLEQLQSPQKRRLQKDRLYEVHVREAGSTLMVGAARILVANDAAEGALPTEPADLVAEAVNAMAKKPTRTGDAWLALSRLPPAWLETELVVRLRLRVTADLGLMDEFARAQEAAWRIVKKPGGAAGR